MYINCKTYYSFRYGTFSTQELVNMAAENGVSSLALTNINSTCDIWEFVQLCNEKNIKPIAGVEVRNNDTFLYLLISANANGLSWIHEFLSRHLMAKKPFPEAAENPSFFNLLISLTITSTEAFGPVVLTYIRLYGILLVTV